LRLGKVLEQYERCVQEQQYEVTLMISILQSLSVNFTEYIKRMSKNEYIPDFTRPYNNCGWGLEGSLMKSSLVDREHILKNYIEHIRNAVSHPNIVDPDSEFPATGFITERESDLIKSVVFIDSPDVKHNKIISYENKDHLEKRIKSYNNIPNNIAPCLDNEKYIMCQSGKPYIRLTIIKLPTSQLRKFIYKLVNLLSQPINPNWDNKTIRLYFPPAA
jgi:transcriptional regulator CtsR